ncbi:hypothetical protein SEA_ALI17_40 [Gordonia phage Ali17]|uniref:Uncharacterized protein n=1 Tax=Gordonia phage Ali17 TaxID=2301561 RepID=A0A385DMY1_9CAUD|nr:membrane protein [Gordonia phage Ali17]AXQ60656.1 hypothetical protein SEA_ALI17_40 [Gordonia phage Ali17]QXN73261.1 membrane protein [Gordonia phage Hans]
MSETNPPDLPEQQEPPEQTPDTTGDQHPHRVPPTWLINLVAITILVVWAASFAVRIIWPDRTLAPSVDALMLIVAGFLFAGNFKDRFTGGRS